MADQLTTIATERMIEKIGNTTPDQIKKIERIICVQLAIWF